MNSINIEKIMGMLPHRYPLLLVDRVISFTHDVGLVAIKNVTINEEFFVGHFPGHPIMPGVLIIEAMAQAAGIFVMMTMSEAGNLVHNQKIVYFMSIEEAHFRKPVVPGDRLHLHVEKIKNRGNVWKMKGEARVDDIKVTDAVFSAMIVDK
jgi:3-hydroxyacyl-[acyl-carrier-protein] dehydratase